MSNKENGRFDDQPSPIKEAGDVAREDPLADMTGFLSQEIPPGVDRRNFLIRSAVGGAAAVMMGTTVSAQERIAMAIKTLPVLPQAAATPPLCAIAVKGNKSTAAEASIAMRIFISVSIRFIQL